MSGHNTVADQYIRHTLERGELWIIDQYQFSTDKRSGITNDPNRDDDPTYIIRLIKKVVTVSVKTVGLVEQI